MILYDKLWETMKFKNKSTYFLREKAGINSKTVRRLKPRRWINCAPRWIATDGILWNISKNNTVNIFTIKSKHPSFRAFAFFCIFLLQEDIFSSIIILYYYGYKYAISERTFL